MAPRLIRPVSTRSVIHQPNSASPGPPASGTSVAYRQDEGSLSGDRGTARLMGISRRQFLGGGLIGASLVLGGCGGSSLSPMTGTLPRKVLRSVGSLPRADMAAGTDLVPQIEHFVVVMM